MFAYSGHVPSFGFLYLHGLANSVPTNFAYGTHVFCVMYGSVLISCFLGSDPNGKTYVAIKVNRQLFLQQ